MRSISVGKFVETESKIQKNLKNFALGPARGEPASFRLISTDTKFARVRGGGGWGLLTEIVADRLGICLSTLCVVHCLLTPFLFLILPSVRLMTIHESYHRAMVVVLPLLAIAAFIPGYRLHRDALIFRWSIPGLILILVGATVFHENVALEILASVLGSLFLIRAHFLNRKFCACCKIDGSSAKGRR